MGNREKRQKSFALTGDTDFIRPYLMLLLMKRGFRVTEHPAKGIIGLICGNNHKPSKEVTSHLKYKIAVKNKVSIITMDILPQVLGITNISDEVAELRKEIIVKKVGNSGRLAHFIWQGITRFIVLPTQATNAICNRDFFSKEISYA